MKKKNIKFDWKNKTKKEKTMFIVKCILLLGIVAFVVLALFSEKIFGADNIFTQNVGKMFNLFNGIKLKLPTILTSLSYIVIILALSWLLRLLLRSVLNKINKGKSIVNLLDSFIKYGAAILLVFLVLAAWGVDTSALLASAGILGLVIGLGAQSLIEDVIAGLFIIFEKTFEVGDIVVIDGFRGTIQEIGIRNTKLVDAGGDTKVISNSDIRTVINMTSDLSLAICDVAVEYGESIERVETVIKANLEKIQERIPAITEGPFYKGVASLADSGVVIKIIAKCKEQDKYQTERDLNREIKIIFDKNNINIPFPQVVINQPIDFKGISKKQRDEANAFVDEQKELSKHINEESQQ